MDEPISNEIWQRLTSYYSIFKRLARVGVD